MPKLSLEEKHRRALSAARNARREAEELREKNWKLRRELHEANHRLWCANQDTKLAKEWMSITETQRAFEKTAAEKVTFVATLMDWTHVKREWEVQ